MFLTSPMWRKASQLAAYRQSQFADVGVLADSSFQWYYPFCNVCDHSHMYLTSYALHSACRSSLVRHPQAVQGHSVQTLHMTSTSVLFMRALILKKAALLQASGSFQEARCVPCTLCACLPAQ